MRVVVIGATGHVGGYLVPRLVAGGHEVIALSRGQQQLYREDPSWDDVRRVVVDRTAEENAGTFSSTVADLKPDVVVDMLCFQVESARQLVNGLRGRIQLLVSCGSIWVHGYLTEIPGRESDLRRPWGDFGPGKAEIEDYLLAESCRDGGVPSVLIHPGHICGPGWRVINPIGNTDITVWEKLSWSRELVVPNFGLETLHHVHADDVAQLFELAIEQREQAAGQSFNAVSDRALTVRGFAESVAGWFGREAVLRFAPFEQFRASTSEAYAAETFEHVARSQAMSNEKAKQMLGYAPRYSSLEAVAEAVAWLQRDGQLKLSSQLAG